MALRYEPKLMKIADGAAGGTPIRCTEATYKHNLEGVDELTTATTERLDYTDRVIFQDRMGEWHEMMYDTGRHGHETGDVPSGSVKLYSSVNELWDSYVLDKRPSGNVAAVLSVVLGGTRWTFGQNVDVDGTRSFVFYHKSVRECIKEVCDSFGCFFQPRIEVQNGKIVARRIDVFRELGETPKRFTWTKDLLSVYREVGDEKPKTRIYGWGKGVETDSGGYGRRLSFADINGGKAYVEDTDATAALGYVGYDGKRMPLEGEYVNEQCEDAAQLLAETRAYLAGVSQPSVRYTADVISLADFGREWENVQVGETAAIIDKEFSEDGLRLRGQVAEMTEDLINQRTVVGFGTITDILSARQAQIAQRLASVRSQSAGWQQAASAGPSWLQMLMDNLNAQFDSAGTYRFSSFEHGDIWSNVPLDENGRATKAGGWAININGLGFRMASSLKSDGSWNWRTFGTGKGFVADEINAGKLTDKKGLNFWNLDTGELQMAATSTLGGKTVQEIIDGVDATITDTDMEYAQGTSPTQAPTSGWQTQPPAWEAGKYIWQRLKTTTASGVSYSDPVMISGRDGADGQQGPAGANGESNYIHTAWANSADGTTDFSTTVSAGKSYLGVCTDQNTADPSTPSSYSWSKIEGEAGADGIGIVSITEQFARSTSTTPPEQASTLWIDDQPSYSSGYYYFTRSKITWEDNRVTYTDGILARALTSANQNAASAQSTASSALDKANANETTLNTLNTQQGIFNKLTNNGETQGIYLSGGKVYINGTYIKTGTLDASQVTIENLARIGKDGGWHLALGGDNITMTDEKDAAAMVIKGKKQAVVGWQQTNFRFGVEYEVPEAAIDGVRGGMSWRRININLGYIAEYFGTQSAQYEVSQPYPATTALIEHRGHGSGTSISASQTFVQLHFKFNQNGKTIVWATAHDADMRDITSQVENLPFIALSFKVDKPSVDINLAEGADSVLTKQNFNELMSAGGTVPYTGTFTVVYARNNIFRYIDLTFVNGLLITTATRTL